MQLTSTGTKTEDAQSLAYSFQQSYSTHKQDKHSQKTYCQNINVNLIWTINLNSINANVTENWVIVDIHKSSCEK